MLSEPSHRHLQMPTTHWYHQHKCKPLMLQKKFRSRLDTLGTEGALIGSLGDATCDCLSPWFEASRLLVIQRKGVVILRNSFYKFFQCLFLDIKSFTKKVCIQIPSFRVFINVCTALIIRTEGIWFHIKSKWRPNSRHDSQFINK